MIVGHAEQQRAFLDAFSAGHPHHAWLLTGPKGIGKARFALTAAAYALTPGGREVNEDGSPRLALKAGQPNIGLGVSTTHPDFRLIEREIDEKTGKLRAQIVIAQLRSLPKLLQSHSDHEGWRVVVIDAVDDVREGAANAFLKLLEEPPAKTLIFLVSHSPGRLLPTIRSRCRTLRFQPLPIHEVAQVVAAELPDTDERERVALVALAEGSPGRALRFAGLDIEGLTRSLDALGAAPPPRRQGLALSLAKTLAAKAAQPRYEAFLEIAPARLAAAARTRPSALPLWEKAHDLASGALPLQLDPQAVAFELATLVAAA